MGREWVPRVIENDLVLLKDKSNTQHVPRTGREWVPRVIENDLLLLRNESNTQIKYTRVIENTSY